MVAVDAMSYDSTASCIVQLQMFECAPGEGAGSIVHTL